VLAWTYEVTPPPNLAESHVSSGISHCMNQDYKKAEIEFEKALDCLENCLIKVGNISREWLVHDADMDNIRNHPRYEKIISSFPE